jgi:hypothetical protein
MACVNQRHAENFLLEETPFTSSSVKVAKKNENQNM